MTQTDFLYLIETPLGFVNKDCLTWDELMLTPDTPTVARYRQTRETSMWFAIGRVA